jgi:hypothetical protein
MGAIVSFPCEPKVGTKDAGHGAIDISHIENKPSFFLALNVLIKRQDLSPWPYVWGPNSVRLARAPFPITGIERGDQKTQRGCPAPAFLFKPFP